MGYGCGERCMIIAGNFYLTLIQMQNNANYIHAYLVTRGWSKNAVCAMLGNMQTESTINPGIWQNLDEGNMSLGYGLVQWTPASKYWDWLNGIGITVDSVDYQLARLQFEIDNDLQWIETADYPLSFEDFKTSNATPEYLAQAFLRNYERPANQSQPNRSTQARYWYNYLNDVQITEPSLLPINYIRITQGEGGTYSHEGTLSIDFAPPFPEYPYFAPCEVECVAVLPTSTTVVWKTVNPVICPDGVTRNYVFSCIHETPLWQNVGMILQQNELMGHTGIGGTATGDHLHLQVIDGDQYNGFYQNSYGNWSLVGTELHIYNTFFYRRGAELIDTYGYDWKEWDGSINPPDPEPPGSNYGLIPLLLSKAINGW